MPRAVFKMLSLAMRREQEDSKGDGYARARDPAGTGDEFVDILQVQQLLLDSGGAANGGRGRGRGREPPPPAEGRGRQLDAAAAAFAAPPSYYYGSYGTHHTPPAASVDDLVALWFAGPSNTGVFSCRQCHFVTRLLLHLIVVCQTTCCALSQHFTSNRKLYIAKAVTQTYIQCSITTMKLYKVYKLISTITLLSLKQELRKQYGKFKIFGLQYIMAK